MDRMTILVNWDAVPILTLVDMVRGLLFRQVLLDEFI